MLFQCEWRADARRCAFLCKLSSKVESGSYVDFKSSCFALSPAFDVDALRLATADGYDLSFRFERDQTQYLG